MRSSKRGSSRAAHQFFDFLFGGFLIVFDLEHDRAAVVLVEFADEVK